MSVPRPAPSYVETDDDQGNYGWPLPDARLRPATRGPAPRAARRRSLLDVAWIALGVLGVAAAAVSAVWYLRLGGSTPAEVAVPRVIGLSEQAAVRQLTTEGFAVRAIEQPAEASAGVVFAQRPSVEAHLARGALVTISVANGQTTRNMTALGLSR